MSSDFNFTVASWFLGNVCVKPISTHSAPSGFLELPTVLVCASAPHSDKHDNCILFWSLAYLHLKERERTKDHYIWIPNPSCLLPTSASSCLPFPIHSNTSTYVCTCVLQAKTSISTENIVHSYYNIIGLFDSIYYFISIFRKIANSFPAILCTIQDVTAI